MTNGLLPPFVDPEGERADDAAVIAAFATGISGPPHSERLHVEGPVLLADREVPAAIRIDGRAVLVRTDLPEKNAAAVSGVAEVLRAEGRRLLDCGTPLGVPVALQMVGLRISTWDLWGADLDEAFDAVRSAAAGMAETIGTSADFET